MGTTKKKKSFIRFLVSAPEEKMKAALFLLAIVFAAADAGFMDPGPCPKAAPLATFDALEFSGDWYMISFKPNMMESATLQCRKMNFQVGADNVITMTSTDKVQGQIKTATRTAAWNPQDGGLMTMRQMGMIVPYSILSTDYTNSAASWSCVEMFGMHVEVEWLWSRQPTLDTETKSALTKMMKDAGIKVDEMIDVKC